jgi:dTMP kinase
MKKLKIYVSCALKHASESYKNMIAEFKKRLAAETGHEILEFVTNPDQKTPEEIYDNDIPKCVMISDVIIADLTHPSTGLGYEMATKIELQMGRVIGLAKEGTEISKFILGVPNFSVRYYQGLDEMVALAKMCLEDFLENQGKLIVIDGLDGSGKATQARELVERLRKEGKRVETFDFPHPTNHFGKLIYEGLGGKHGDFAGTSPYIISPLYAADRFESSFMIKKWLSQGAIVVLDRYVSANQIHQGGKIDDDAKRKEFLEWLDHMEHGIFGIPRPDQIIYLDVPVEISQKLAKEKAALDKKQHYGTTDQHEDDIDHLRNAKESGLKMIASTNSWKRIQCYEKGEMLPVSVIHNKVWECVSDVIGIKKSSTLNGLRELGSNYEKAEHGKFRATVLIDSLVYQIGEDAPTVDEAIILCSRFRGMDHGVQIFNDKGIGLVKNGKINGIAV